MRKCALVLLCVAGTSVPVSAAPTFVASLGNQLVVRTGNSQSQYTLSDAITAMAVSPTGTIYATSPTDDGNGLYELYTIDNVLTSPTLTLVGDFLTEKTPTISFIGNTLYGIQNLDASDPNSRLVTIDIGGQSESIVGADGLLINGIAASGYDSVNDILYALAKPPGPGGTTHTVDYTTPSASPVGLLGERSNNMGAEYYHGTLYAAIQDVSAVGDGLPDVDLDLGTINVATGEITYFANLIANYDPQGENVAVGLAVIPTPGAMSLMALGAAVGLRRRRG